MTNLLQKFEQQQLAKIMGDKVIPDFQAGDTLRVGVLIVEGKTERVQAFEGLCIARKNDGLNSAFTVRKISHGEGVERIFPLYSPRISFVEVVRRGVVRRAKLYYMRDLTGKAARITEKRQLLSKDGDGNAQAPVEKAVIKKGPKAEGKKVEKKKK